MQPKQSVDGDDENKLESNIDQRMAFIGNQLGVATAAQALIRLNDSKQTNNGGYYFWTQTVINPLIAVSEVWDSIFPDSNVFSEVVCKEICDYLTPSNEELKFHAMRCLEAAVTLACKQSKIYEDYPIQDLVIAKLIKLKGVLNSIPDDKEADFVPDDCGSEPIQKMKYRLTYKYGVPTYFTWCLNPEIFEGSKGLQLERDYISDSGWIPYNWNFDKEAEVYRDCYCDAAAPIGNILQSGMLKVNINSHTAMSNVKVNINSHTAMSNDPHWEIDEELNIHIPHSCPHWATKFDFVHALEFQIRDCYTGMEDSWLVIFVSKSWREPSSIHISLRWINFRLSQCGLKANGRDLKDHEEIVHQPDHSCYLLNHEEIPWYWQ